MGGAARAGAEQGAVPTLALDNATILFVHATDGRGEGLAGMYLAPGTEPAPPRELEICGMRITVEGATPA
ncbi:MAG: hypothetical protein QM686_14790 [Herbaspirillum sp.]